MGLKNLLNLLLSTMVSIVLSCCFAWILVEMFILFTSFFLTNRSLTGSADLRLSWALKQNAGTLIPYIIDSFLCRDWGHILFYLLFLRGKDEPGRVYLEEKGLFVGSAPPQRCLEPSPHPLPQGLDEKRIQQLLCFTCCKKYPPKKHKVSLQRTPVARWTT